MKKYLIVIVVSCLMLCLLVTGCESLTKLLQNPDYIYENGAILVDGGDQPIHLINNPAAVDASFKDVLAFIRQDTTDLIEYVDRGNTEGIIPFVCSDFAEAVHNNAENAGIRAAYVSIDWEDGSIGHALNAFETLDSGLVYFDCTGNSVFSQVEDTASKIALGSWDKVAYLELWKKYGVIGLAYAESPEYGYFEQFDLKWLQYKQLLADYNAAVIMYNQEIEGKVFRLGTAEYKRLQDWEDELIARENVLEELSLEIGDSRFKPMGVVSNIVMHW